MTFSSFCHKFEKKSKIRLRVKRSSTRGLLALALGLSVLKSTFLQLFLLIFLFRIEMNMVELEKEKKCGFCVENGNLFLYVPTWYSKVFEGVENCKRVLRSSKNF